MTIRFLGISFRLNASVEVIIRFLSNGMKGKIVGFEPVAIITLSAVMLSSVLSVFIILMVFLSVKEPKPL